MLINFFGIQKKSSKPKSENDKLSSNFKSYDFIAFSYNQGMVSKTFNQKVLDRVTSLYIKNLSIVNAWET